MHENKPDCVTRPPNFHGYILKELAYIYLHLLIYPSDTRIVRPPDFLVIIIPRILKWIEDRISFESPLFFFIYKVHSVTSADKRDQLWTCNTPMWPFQK